MVEELLLGVAAHSRHIAGRNLGCIRPDIAEAVDDRQAGCSSSGIRFDRTADIPELAERFARLAGNMARLAGMRLLLAGMNWQQVGRRRVVGCSNSVAVLVWRGCHPELLGHLPKS